MSCQWESENPRFSIPGPLIHTGLLKQPVMTGFQCLLCTDQEIKEYRKHEWVKCNHFCFDFAFVFAQISGEVSKCRHNCCSTPFLNRSDYVNWVYVRITSAGTSKKEAISSAVIQVSDWHFSVPSLSATWTWNWKGPSWSHTCHFVAVLLIVSWTWDSRSRWQIYLSLYMYIHVICT